MRLITEATNHQSQNKQLTKINVSKCQIQMPIIGQIPLFEIIDNRPQIK
jgi:hypothetical protein